MLKSAFYLTIIFLTVNNYSAQESERQKIEPNLCDELGKMMVEDQKYRKLPGINEMGFFIVLDSLKNVNNISQKEYTNLSEEEQLVLDKKAREITDKLPKYSRKEKDSIWQLQNQIDSYNTKRLIEIIKRNGWVTMQNLECKEYFATWAFFRHASKKYFDQIRELIDKELEIGNLGKSEYLMIDNHLKGRPIYDFNYVED